MREIKFKFWNTINKRWDGDLLATSGYYQNPFSRSDIIPCQYTGLKDKNGVPIYEGDIVIWEINEGSDGYPNIVRGLYVVSWCEKEGLWIFRDPHSGETWKMFDTEFDEIIGNIYENPELVEQKGGGR